MADIKTILNKILSASLGRDVRQAIHDGIETCYTDGKAGSIDLIARQEINALDERVSTAESDINVLDARMDSFASLPEGSTSGDAELADIRVGADGITYDSAGNAVRTQISGLQSDLTDLQNGVADIATPVITEIIGEETLRKAILASGILTDISSDNYRVIKYPVTAGKKYWITASSNYGNLLWCFYDSNDVAVQTGTASNSGSGFTIVENEMVTAPTRATSLVLSYNSQKSLCSCKIQTGLNLKIEDDINNLSATVDDFTDIAVPIINSLTGEETLSKAINSFGRIYTVASDNYRIVKYSVTAGKTYWVSGSTNYGNALWCFYGTDDSVVSVGTISANESTITNLTDTEVTAPRGASYIIVSYIIGNTTADCKTQIGYNWKTQWKGKKWVCVGDSLTEINDRTTKHYFDYVADETGITTVNMGDSGSGYAREQDVGTAFYQRIGDCPTDADVVTIFGSFNDLGSGLPLGSADDTGTTTIAGCINTTIDNLQAVIPLVNLGIVAPTPWDTTQPNTSGNAYNYVEMLNTICERRSIPFLDLWRCSNLRPWDSDFRELAYSKDEGNGVHPDETGHKLIAPRFKAFLETLIM